MTILIIPVVLVLVLIGGLLIWRWSDVANDRAEMARLLATREAGDPDRFSYDMLEGLPEPAQRYFRFAIAEGAALKTAIELDMQGQFSLGTKDKPGYMPMKAKQVLAAPEGFVWQMWAGKGAMRVSGSDSHLWSRFWINGLLPVARLGGTEDLARAAFGRCAAEAVFWAPASVLPGPDVRWEAVNDTTVRMVMTHGDLEQAVDLTVDCDGAPVEVRFERWSDANPEKVYQFQTFGGYLSACRTFDGFTIPTNVEAGNFFGSDDYFPFFLVDVTGVRFV